MQILSPVRQVADIGTRGFIADRLPSLAGQRIVAIWNGRRPGPGREFLEEVLKELDRRHGLKSWDILKKPFLGNAAPAELMEELVASGARGALTGLGD